jgi:hypothetical protein
MSDTLYPVSFAPGDNLGYKEGLDNLLPRLITPTEAPVYKELPKTRAVAALHEWMVDKLAVKSLPTPEVFDAEPDYKTTSNRSRVGNRVQKFTRVWSVAEIAELLAGIGGVNGIKSEVQYAIEQAVNQLARTIEFVVTSAQTRVTDNGTLGAALEGFASAIVTGKTDLGAVDLANAVNGVTETKFSDALAAMFERGAKGPLIAIEPPSVVLDQGRTYVGRSKVQEIIERSKHEIDTMVETYAAPVGGIVSIHPDRNCSEVVLILDKSQAKIAELSPLRTYERDPNSFQNRQGRVTTYLTTEWGNEKAHAVFVNDNTASNAGDHS